MFVAYGSVLLEFCAPHYTECSMPQCSVVWCDAVQCSAVQRIATHLFISAVNCSMGHITETLLSFCDEQCCKFPDGMLHPAGPEFTVVLTGFGPFESFSNNPSEKVVQRITEEGIKDSQMNVRIIGRVMPVAYDDVQFMVSELWEKFYPDLVVHLGAHSVSRSIKIETRSCGVGYYQGDIKSKTPRDYRCPLANSSCMEDENTICTGLNCKEILDAIKKEFAEEDVQFQVSDDPGRYLCAYSYYISLRRNKNCSLFVHIPRFNESCTVELITRIVKRIVRLSLLQVLQTSNQNHETLCDDSHQQEQSAL
uniref:Pyroglutamyl-peptidase I n=1 Tax=Setaria digitata TaxID=48799 RepID=A0A915PVK9_9BILA